MTNYNELILENFIVEKSIDLMTEFNMILLKNLITINFNRTLILLIFKGKTNENKLWLRHFSSMMTIYSVGSLKSRHKFTIVWKLSFIFLSFCILYFLLEYINLFKSIHKRDLEKLWSMFLYAPWARIGNRFQKYPP